MVDAKVLIDSTKLRLFVFHPGSFLGAEASAVDIHTDLEILLIIGNQSFCRWIAPSMRGEVMTILSCECVINRA